MKAYLDFNIYVLIENGKLKVTDLLQLDNRISVFPFSASHIQETDNTTSPDENKRENYIKSRLEIISEVSQNSYLYHRLKDDTVIWVQETPFNVLETIREIPFAKTGMQSFMNLISSEQKDELRSTLGISTKELNNYNPEEVLEHLNKKLINWGTTDTFLELIERGIQMHPNGKTFGLDNRIAAIYELLDLMGYWKDKETETSNYARFWDSSHAFFASHCDYFISDDKRNRNKAKVVYSIYNVTTKVLSLEG